MVVEDIGPQVSTRKNGKRRDRKRETVIVTEISKKGKVWKRTTTIKRSSHKLSGGKARKRKTDLDDGNGAEKKDRKQEIRNKSRFGRVRIQHNSLEDLEWDPKMRNPS